MQSSRRRDHRWGRTAGTGIRRSGGSRSLPSALRSVVHVALLVAVALSLPGCDRSLRPAGPGHAHRAPAGGTAFAVGAILEARVTRVRDGDSFDAMLADGRAVGVRIAAIDAPERGQPFADAARRRLLLLVSGRRIRATVVAVDRYDRAVALVATAPTPAEAADAPPEPTAAGPAPGAPEAASVDVGLEQVRAGLAWYYRRYAGDLPAPWPGRYDEAERRARRDRAGLWHDASPQPPWRHREAARVR